MENQRRQQLVRVALPCDAGAPRLARAALRDMLAPGPGCDDAVLLASELVTNAVQFSGCTAGELITLAIARDGQTLRIAVHDPALTTTAPQVREPDADRIGGQGLRIVERLAHRWGVEDNDDGRCVWAEMP